MQIKAFLVGGGGEIVMAPVNFVSKKLVPTHKHAVRAKNRALDFGQNLPRKFCNGGSHWACICDRMSWPWQPIGQSCETNEVGHQSLVPDSQAQV
jgi:hypothetical protein